MSGNVIEFSPRYNRFPEEITGLLLRIASALGTIRGASVLPAVADQLRSSARAGTVHYSTMIEGNELPFVEAERAARGDLEPDTRAKIELVNYVAALDLIDEHLASGRLGLDADFLKQLHGVTTAGLGREDDPHFKSHHEGQWRDGEAVVVDRTTNQIMHRAPPSAEVGPRMLGMFEWLARKLDTDSQPPYVLAGVMHYGITDVHPFADGNGRVARLFQTALLMQTNVLPGRMYSFERYYAEDQNAYYGALRSVRTRTLNMEQWLQYFLRGLAEEYERVAATVVDLASLVSGPTAGPLQLTSSQQAAISALRIQGRIEFDRRDYEQAARVGRSAANSDLRQLVQHGVLRTRGSGSATRYLFSVTVARPATMKRGRPAHWNEARIERELRAFIAGQENWPSPKEFRDAGRGDLYAAASRAGGISRWRRTLGI